ncbi:MAG: MaoC family dehydratase [Halobacteriota archaeon]
MTRYYEDYEVGDGRSFGAYTVSESEIIDFARRYDPQPIHTDPDAAGASFFGDLIASGWHTASVCMRLLVDHMADDAWVGARGVDELRWITPVYPDDTLSVTVEVVDKDPTPSIPGVGTVHVALTGFNQRDEAVVSWIGLSLIEQRSN